MKPKFTIAELKTMDRNRAQRIEAMKQEITAAEKERQSIRAEMEAATKAFDTKAYDIAADKEEALTKKIRRLVDAVRVIDQDGHSFSDDDVINAWDAHIKGYNEEMLKLIGDYRAAKRALFEKYIALETKQGETLAAMEECSSLLSGKPNKWETPLRRSISVYIPEYGQTEQRFFGDVQGSKDVVGATPCGQTDPALVTIKALCGIL